MALIDDFKARFSQFNTADVDRLFPFVEDLYPCLYNFDYGSAQCDDKAVLYLCAHIMTIELQTNKGAGAGGSYAPSKVVSSKSVGSVSVSYEAGQANASAYQELLSSTVFGQVFLSLTAKRRGGFFV